MATVLAAALDDRLGTMFRFFLIALALAGPVGWWRLMRRGRRRRASEAAGDTGTDVDRHLGSRRDLAWLVGEIGATAKGVGGVEAAERLIELPDGLATMLWGNGEQGADPIALTVVDDAARRSGMRVERSELGSGLVVRPRPR